VCDAATNDLSMSRHVLFALVIFVIAMSASGFDSSTFAQTSSAEDRLIKQARAIHENVIVLDTHIDTEQQIEKLWGGNLLRVMNEVQRVARELQKKSG